MCSGFAEGGTLEGDVPRVMCTRDRIEPTKTRSEQHVEQSFEKLRTWRLEFERHVGSRGAALSLARDDKPVAERVLYTPSMGFIILLVTAVDAVAGQLTAPSSPTSSKPASTSTTGSRAAR